MVLGRLLQRLLARLSAAFMKRRRRIFGVSGIAFVLLFGTAIFNAMNARPQDLQAADYVPTVAGEPRATASFLRGQQMYDANLMWSLLNEDLARSLRQQGRSVEEEQRRLDSLRQAGTKIDSAQYIGGYSIPNGHSIHFYVVQRSGGRTGVEYEPFVFTLDSSGKIERVQ
ncbi:MAG: hypothetical protein A3F84_13520 [Candidatus Handelsmanbacteria bacterium RIFCSPLOWO2_12_FULL_64_10]|uniref:Uncharacterized protein n=1 Tax=Handelsmanbacteria sp. (strain RIFCSPLOWO2_12_FULL_64_10) TaxID=1817868 RepID=A0A1F6CAJ2_HANXR|nr:MAG: hypothetical protein A3F84_13520 [Candidatus Handelsmanbacteria bacterium RIFCSPLOWO2_12_FULL_64_10]